MCRKTESEIRELLKNLPETPTCFLKLMRPGDFHGGIAWEVEQGSMLSFDLLPGYDEIQIYHTRFTAHTKLNWHHHGESIEEVKCLKGALSVIFEDGSQIILKPMDKIEIQKGVKHMAVIDNKPCEIIAITIPKEK